MTEKELYEEYGRLTVQFEIVQIKLNAVKKEIAKLLQPSDQKVEKINE